MNAVAAASILISLDLSMAFDTVPCYHSIVLEGISIFKHSILHQNKAQKAQFGRQIFYLNFF